MSPPRKGKNFICIECGEEFYRSLADIKRNRTRFCSRKCAGVVHRGNNNYNWNGGYSIDEKGYKRIHIGNSYQYEHRLVMEKFLGRKLLPSEIVHHLDHNKTNNKIENLEILSQSQHMKEHLKDKYLDRNLIIQYRNQGLSFIQIGKIMNKNPGSLWKAVHRRGTG